MQLGKFCCPAKLHMLTRYQVSKHIRRVIAQSSRLQYSIELQKARMVSILPPSSSSPFASRLKLLRERECNWRYINWAKRHTLSLPPTGSVYEFVGGIYGNGREDDSRVTASISFLELPSTDASFLNESKETLQAWTHCMGDVNIIDFTMDPSQDLLVLVALAPPECVFSYIVTCLLLPANSGQNMFTSCTSGQSRQINPTTRHHCISFHVG